MEITILDGACTLSIGNPNRAKRLIAQEAVEPKKEVIEPKKKSESTNNLNGQEVENLKPSGKAPNGVESALSLAWVFGRFISGVEGVAVNDSTNIEARLIWDLWDATETITNYHDLFAMLLDLSVSTVNEISDALQQAQNARYAAPPELQTSDEESLDPNLESVAQES